MATTTVTNQIEDNSLTSITQLISTPKLIIRISLTQVNENESFIEALPNTDLAHKCNDLIAKKLINIRESDLNETGVLLISNEYIIEFLNGFKPTPANERLLRSKARSNRFLLLDLKVTKASYFLNS